MVSGSPADTRLWVLACAKIGAVQR